MQTKRDAVKQFLHKADKGEKALYEILHTYTKEKSTGYAAKYALADAVRETLSQYHIKKHVLREVADLVCMARSSLTELLLTTSRISEKEYTALYKRASKNKVVLHWTLVCYIMCRIKDTEQRKTLLQIITDEQVTRRELAEIVTGVNGKKKVPVKKPTVVLPVTTPVTVPASGEDVCANGHPHLTTALKQVRTQLTAIFRHATHLTEKQELLLLDDLDAFLAMLQIMSEIDIPKVRHLYRTLDNRVQGRVQSECDIIRQAKGEKPRHGIGRHTAVGDFL